MTTEIAVRVPEHMSLPDKITYAKALADSNLLPQQYRKNPANLLFALEYADALGVAPIHAITSIHVIDGKPSASADLIATMVRRAGHKMRITGDDSHAVAQIIRADDPEFTFEARWDMAKARAANLTGKSVWKNYPAAMLRSRAITEVARMAAPDALFGVAYTAEELGAEVNSEGQVIALPSQRADEHRVIEPQVRATPPVEVVVRSIAEATTPEAVDKIIARLEALGIEDTEVEDATLLGLATARRAAITEELATLRPVVEVLPPAPRPDGPLINEDSPSATAAPESDDDAIPEPPAYWSHEPDPAEDCKPSAARTGVLKTLTDLGEDDASLSTHFGRPVAQVATRWLRDRVKGVIAEQRAGQKAE